MSDPITTAPRKNVESRLAELRGFLKPGDEKDEHGNRRPMADLLDIAMSRQDEGKPPASPQSSDEAKQLSALLSSARMAAQQSATRIAELEKELADANSRCAGLQSALDNLNPTAAIAEATAEVARQRDAFRGERDTALAELTKSKNLLSSMERLCGVHGVSPADAVPSVSEPAAKSTVAAWEAKVRAANTPAEATKIAKDFEAALNRGEVV